MRTKEGKDLEKENTSYSETKKKGGKYHREGRIVAERVDRRTWSLAMP